MYAYIERFWNSLWNPYTFPGAEKAVALMLMGIALITVLAWLFGGFKAAYKAAAMALLAFWVFSILAATLLDRKEMYEPKVKLELFWTLKYALEHRSGIHWFYLIGNIALFVPLGFLLPASFKWCRRWYVVMVLGGLLSLGVESAQYVWKLGLMEMDDILHNTWGTVLGYCIYSCCHTVRYRAWRKIHKWFLPLLILSGSIGGIVYLISLNPPDWGGIWL